MNRRALLITGAAAALTPMIPVDSEAYVVTQVWSTPGAPGGIEWLMLFKAMGYDLRTQYVANLRALENERISRIADLLDDMNEREAFSLMLQTGTLSR